MSKHKDRLKAGQEAIATWKPDFGCLPPLPPGWRVLSLRLRLSGKWCVRIQKISYDVHLYAGGCDTPEAAMRTACMKADDYDFRQQLASGKTSGLTPFTFDPTLSSMERTLRLAEARAEMRARDPEKYDELTEDAKMYPEREDDDEEQD